MEGLGLSEIELNKERIASLKQEYQMLSYEMKKREKICCFKKNKWLQLIKHQGNKIEELNKEKEELTLQIHLCNSQSFKKPGSRLKERFFKSLDEMIKLEQQIQKQTSELQQYYIQITKIEKKIRQKQKGLIHYYSFKDKILEMQKDTNLLQNRLNAILTKYNIVLKTNHALKDDIKSILQTQAAFCKQYAHLKHLISQGKKNILEIVNVATSSYLTSESAKFKLNLLKERTQADLKKLEEKIKDLQLLIEQDKQLKAFIEFKGRDRGIMSEQEVMESNKDQVMEKTLQDYQSLLNCIQNAANCKDVSKICQVFTQLEEMNVSLFEKVNSLNVEIEKLQEEVDAEQDKLGSMYQHFKDQNRKDLAEKTNVDSLTDKHRQEAEDIKEVAEEKSRELEHTKRKLLSIYQLLALCSNQGVTLTVDEVITDDNILLYLEALEKRVLELIECLRVLDKKHTYLCHEE